MAAEEFDFAAAFLGDDHLEAGREALREEDAACVAVDVAVAAVSRAKPAKRQRRDPNAPKLSRKEVINRMNAARFVKLANARAEKQKQRADS